ncbi:MAG: CotH kinase family protein [Bacteroidia bacterium]|nr:CotH kinase family protein [Bacteroidia bacterium]
MMKIRSLNPFLLVLITACTFFHGRSQTFTGVGGQLKDDGTLNIFPLKIAGLPTALDQKFGLEKICVNIQHTWDADVSIYLIAPDGAVAELNRRNGDGGNNFTDCCFSQDAEVSINEGEAPFTGTYRPEIAFGGLNNGQNPNGTWKLAILDIEPEEETGKVLNWKLVFGKNPAKPYFLAESSLPIVVIKSQGEVVRDEPKSKVRIGIIDNGTGNLNHPQDPWNGFDGFAGMEYRGRSSQRHSKMSFAIETRDSLGEKPKSAKLLDLPKESEFVLTANFSDKSLLRNFLAYDIFGKMGHYSPRVRFVDLVMDGEYRGIYLLGEKIKRGNKRVDIAKLDKDDNAGDSLTGGYIIKTDWKQGANNDGWESQFYPMRSDELQYWLFHYPESDDITDPQRAYIHAYVDSFELACNKGLTDEKGGYPHFIDVPSFIDVMIVAELAKNVDAFWLSSYYYKDRSSKGGKLHAGPIWDYDLGFGNFEHHYGYSPSGWHWEEYGTTSDKTPFWWDFLARDPAFQNQMKCRWLELRKGILSQERLFAVIDSAAASINDSQQENFQVWQILGEYVWPNAKPYEPDYEGEVRRIKYWLVTRMAWMDAFMPGTCK